MISEKYYWLILIVGLGIFVIIDLVWILPLHEDFGISLLTDAIFTIFTIVFLTWVISFREARQWKIVEAKIRERIRYRLFKIFSDISAYFLKPFPQLPDKLSRMPKKKDKMNERIKEGAVNVSSLVACYASKETVELGETVEAFLEHPDKELAKHLIEDFRGDNDFLEHIISEYSRFLPPPLRNAIMEIEDCLDEITNVLWVISMSGDHSTIDKKRSESRLKEAIHKIIREINQLNEMRLGF